MIYTKLHAWCIRDKGMQMLVTRCIQVKVGEKVMYEKKKWKSGGEEKKARMRIEAISIVGASFWLWAWLIIFVIDHIQIIWENLER